MTKNTAFIVLEWIDAVPGYARYGFATVKHAEELGSSVKWLQEWSSLELAAENASRLNLGAAEQTAQHASA